MGSWLWYFVVQAVNAANAQLLPIMLATKSLPEMEAEQTQLLSRQQQQMGSQPLGSQFEKLGVSSK